MSVISIAILVFLVISLIIVLFVFNKLYSKIKSSDKDNFNLVEFPKETDQKISNFIKNSEEKNKELYKYLENQYKGAKEIIKEVDDKIAPFEKVAREKNDELKEYKKGYEYNRNKSIIDGVIETIEFINNAEKKIEIKDEVLKSYFSTTKDKLIIILNNSGIDSFEPNLNSQSLDDHSCEVDINTEETSDEKKNNLIFKVLKPGYKIKLTDNDTKILKKALVKVYEFKKKDDSINK